MKHTGSSGGDGTDTTNVDYSDENDNSSVISPLLLPLFLPPPESQPLRFVPAHPPPPPSSSSLMQYGSIHPNATTSTGSTNDMNDNDMTQSPRFNRLTTRSSILAPDSSIPVEGPNITAPVVGAVTVKEQNGSIPVDGVLSTTDHHQHHIYHSTTTSSMLSNATTIIMSSNTHPPVTTTTTASSTSTSLISILQQLKPFLYYIIYAIVNVIISVPGLYGYSAIIFNHSIFVPYRNTLSKLVICSSLVHQLAFTSCSTIHTFAIGTVQDAGLIFLSTMANHLTNTILQEENDNMDGSGISPEKERIILSTVLVLLSFGTATLGAVLILMGHFRLAEYVLLTPCSIVYFVFRY